MTRLEIAVALRCAYVSAPRVRDEFDDLIQIPSLGDCFDEAEDFLAEERERPSVPGDGRDSESPAKVY